MLKVQRPSSIPHLPSADVVAINIPWYGSPREKVHTVDIPLVVHTIKQWVFLHSSNDQPSVSPAGSGEGIK